MNTANILGSDDARRVIGLAQHESRMLRHTCVGTEHLLLALFNEGLGTAAEALNSLGLSYSSVHRKVVELMGQGQEAMAGYIPLTSRAKTALELSSGEAVRLGRSHVDTEHILLGLLREGDGIGIQVLAEMGVDPNRLRRQVLALSGSAADPGPPPPAATPLLDRFSRDLSRAALVSELDPVVGRTTEIKRIIQILSRRQRNVPLLVGDPGVGKASIVAGLAHATAAGTAPAAAAGRRVHSLDAGTLFTDPHYHGRFAELMSGLLAELQRSDGLILFLDNALTVLHTPDGRAETLAFFRPALACAGVSVIAACTTSEFRRRGPDPSLDRLLQPLEIDALSGNEVQEILTRARPRLEQHHHVAITDEALQASAALAREHLPGQALPGSAIDLLDQAAAVAGARTVAPHADPVADAYELELAERRRHLDSATASQDLVLARHYGEVVNSLTAALAEQRRKTAPDGPPGRRVTAAEVTEALTAYTGLLATTVPHTRPPARPAQPGPHDPDVWAMS
ncbi:AAA family ATPase [Kitasatospora sp. NBC_00085]|uniref:Clp protease N-terminal domain-containing protein n=1 Tax=unclassified Kitasatospora TaxID=2633591 RepID=UPI00324954F6